MIHYFYGFFVGLFIASMGAWKDTLFEDFSWQKFIRSPIVVEVWYLILYFSIYNKPVILILLSSAALERLTIEFWKAIRRQPPGKFKNPTKDRGWILERVKKSDKK